MYDAFRKGQFVIMKLAAKEQIPDAAFGAGKLVPERGMQSGCVAIYLSLARRNKNR